MHSPHATFALRFLSACPHPITILSSTTQQLKPSTLHIILILPCSQPISENPSSVFSATKNHTGQERWKAKRESPDEPGNGHFMNRGFFSLNGQSLQANFDHEFCHSHSSSSFRNVSRTHLIVSLHTSKTWKRLDNNTWVCFETLNWTWKLQAYTFS